MNQGLLIQREIGPGALLPAVVAAHAVLNESPPARGLVAIESQRAAHGVEQGARARNVENKTRRLVDPLVEIDNGVGEPARAPHQRRRAVAQAVDLIEAAGLVTRGHQEEIGAGLDAVGERFAETDADVTALRIVRGQRREGLLEGLVVVVVVFFLFVFLLFFVFVCVFVVFVFLFLLVFF